MKPNSLLSCQAVTIMLLRKLENDLSSSIQFKHAALRLLKEYLGFFYTIFFPNFSRLLIIAGNKVQTWDLMNLGREWYLPCAAAKRYPADKMYLLANFNASGLK